VTDKKRVCKKCERDFKPEAGWDYPICKECSMKLYSTTEHFWFTEILGYSETLGEFLPSLPKPLFHESMKGYVMGDPRFDISDPDRDRKIVADMKATGKAEHEKILKKSPKKAMTCKKCSKEYHADGVWPYNICHQCAIEETMEWGKYWIKRVPLASQIPPIDVMKYSIDGV